MMDIDRPQQVVANKLGSQNLHVSRRHHQVDVLPDQIHHLLLTLPLVLWRGQQMKRNPIEVGQWLGLIVVADDDDDVATQFTCTVPIQQVGKAMAVSRNQDDDLGAMIGQCQMVLDLILLSQRVKVPLKVRDWNVEACEVPLQPRKEHCPAAVYVIISVQDPTVVRYQKLGDGCHYPLMCISNRSAKQQNSCTHSCILGRRRSYSRPSKYFRSGSTRRPRHAVRFDPQFSVGSAGTAYCPRRCVILQKGAIFSGAFS